MPNKNIFIISLIMIALIIGGILFWQMGEFRQPTSETPKVEKPETITTTDWSTYRSKKYGLQFKYPADLFDEIHIQKSNLDEDDVTDGVKTYGASIIAGEDTSGIDVEAFEYEYLPRIIKEEFIISFKGIKICKSWCGLGIRVMPFTNETRFQYEAYEGTIILIDIIKEREKIEKESNIFIGNLKGMVSDSYFKPGDNFQRFYTVFLPSYKLLLESGYNETDKQEFLKLLEGIISTLKFIE